MQTKMLRLSRIRVKESKESAQVSVQTLGEQRSVQLLTRREKARRRARLRGSGNSIERLRGKTETHCRHNNNWRVTYSHHMNRLSDARGDGEHKAEGREMLMRRSLMHT